MKKNKKDMNDACLKDDFPLLIIDVTINNTCGLERISIMDGFSEYNQIKMYLDDKKYISFWALCRVILLYGDALRSKEYWSHI